MYFVFICCLLSIFFAWLESKCGFKGGLKFGFILVTLVSVFRYGYGCDYFSYIDKFYDAICYEIKDFLSLDQDIREPGWSLLMKLFEPVGPYVFFAFLAIVTNSIYYKFIKKNVRKEDYWLAISIYLLNFDLFVLQQSMMRQAFAMALFVWAGCYIKKINQILYSIDNKSIIDVKKDEYSIFRLLIKLSILLSLIVFIHQSSMVLIPISLIAFVPIKKGKIISIVLFALFCLLWLSSNYVAPIFEQLMVIESVAFYGEKYISDEGARFGIRQVLSFIPFFVSLYYIWDEKISSINKPFVIISMLGVLVLPFASLLQLISRVAYYFDAFAIVTYPIVYRNIKNKYIRYSLIFLFLFIFIYMWFNKSKNPTWEGAFVEYHSLFELL